MNSLDKCGCGNSEGIELGVKDDHHCCGTAVAELMQVNPKTTVIHGATL